MKVQFAFLVGHMLIHEVSANILHEHQGDLGGNECQISPEDTDSLMLLQTSLQKVVAAGKSEGSRGSSFGTDRLHSKGDDGTHHSIFKIKSTALNGKPFKYLMCFMLFFTLLVDRLQALAEWWAGSDRVKVMFVQRIIAELMVFGTVAIALFIFENLQDIPSDIHLLFEFVDVWISFAACFLILLGLVLNYLRSAEKKRFHRQISSCDDFLHALQVHDSIDRIPSPVLYAARSEVLRAQFFCRYQLGWRTFSYDMYMNESIGQAMCDLINIGWVTWVILLVCWLSWTGTHEVLGLGALTIESYIIGCLIVTWVITAASIVSLVWSNLLWKRLLAMLGMDNLETLREGIVEVKDKRHNASVTSVWQKAVNQNTNKTLAFSKVKKRWDEKVSDDLTRWTKVMGHSTQVVSLGMCFMLGLYVMNISYNVTYLQKPWYWHILFVLPLLCDMFLLLPNIVILYTRVQCFCDPKHDVMESIHDQMGQAWSDLLSARDQIIEAAHAQNAGDPKQWAKKELTRSGYDLETALKSMGVWQSTSARLDAMLRLVSRDMQHASPDFFLEQLLDSDQVFSVFQQSQLKESLTPQSSRQPTKEDI